MKKLQQSVSFFLATTILFQSALCWLLVFLSWNQNLNFQKEEIEKNIPTEKLITIQINKTSNAVRVNSTEIEVNGEWFDIVSEAKEDGSEIYYCLSDEMENQLIDQLAEKKNNDKQQGLVSFLKSMNKEYPAFHFAISLTNMDSKQLYISNFEFKILSGYQTILYSPPDFIA